MEGLANKLIQHVELHPELKETLEDFVVGIVDIDKPEEITFEQQKILAEINKYFNENIKNVLQNYDRNIPSRDEYNLIIKGLSEVAAMQRFVQVGRGPSDADEYEQDEQLNLSLSMDSISDNQSNPTSFQSSDHIGNEECSATTPKNQGSFGNIGSNSIPYSSEEKALLNMSASNNKQGAQSEVLLSESKSEDDKSDITVILADTKKEKQAPTQLAEQADSITRESTQPKPVTNEQDISAKDNSKSKPKENNVTSQNKKMYILVTSALVVAGIVSGIAIAVYSGMLAVGIAVGACCLVAAAATYCFNKPSNLLKDSNAEVVVNQGQEL